MKFLPFDCCCFLGCVSCDDDHASISSEAREDELKSDIKYLGAFILELAKGKAYITHSLLQNIVDTDLDEMKAHYLESGFSPAFADFVTNCLAKDVNKQWSLSELMNVRESERNDE